MICAFFLFWRLFLHGLQKYGRGKWRMICWEFLKTRTPIQVASHAQKYFNRPKTPSNKRRTSIHDIRLPNKSTVVNANNAIPKSNYGHFTDSMDATPEGNYGQFANSNNTNPNSNNGHFANTLAQVSASGPSEPYRKICTEPSIPFWWASGMLWPLFPIFFSVQILKISSIYFSSNAGSGTWLCIALVLGKTFFIIYVIFPVCVNVPLV